jgi:transposase
MPAKRYIVRLNDEERQRLSDLVARGTTQAYRIKHANILLKADADGPAWKDAQIAEAFGCHRTTVEGVRKRFVTQSLDAALGRKKRDTPPRERVLDGDAEAKLVAIACGEAPSGRAKWTMRLLAERLVELEIVESISHTTVWETLKKTNSNRTCGNAG